VDENRIKVCIVCKRELPATLEYFTEAKKGKYRLSYVCRGCQQKNDGNEIESNLSMNTSSTTTIYPEQYAGYILWGIIWVILCIVLLVSIITSSNMKLKLDIETVFVCIFLSLPYLYSAIIILTIIQLIKKKIYIQYSEEKVVFKGLLIKKSIKVNDIKSIVKNNYKNLLGYVLIRSKTNILIGDFKDIRFPMAWFSNEDTYRMFDFLICSNKSIFTKGIYATIYRNSEIKKKRR